MVGRLGLGQPRLDPIEHSPEVLSEMNELDLQGADSKVGDTEEARGIELRFEADPTVNYASVQNSVPIGRRLDIQNKTDHAAVNVLVTVKPATPFAQSKKFLFEHLAPGETRRVDVVNLPPEPAYLAALVDAERSHIDCVATEGEGGRTLATARVDVDVLAANQWAGLRALPSLLAAFSQPNIPLIEGILRDASERLRKVSSGASLNAYQSSNREAVWLQLSAIYSAVAALDVQYSQAPASFEAEGQKIRGSEQILQSRLANCLDLSMLLAACLEQAGLHPVVLLSKGHAWLGCWLTDTYFATTVVDDAQAVRKRIDTGEFITFECTGVTTQPKLRLKTAVNKGAENLASEEFGYAIDVRRCREEQVRPLPSRSEFLQSVTANVDTEELEVEPAPALPPLEVGEPIVIGDDTPQGRLARWKAKLLDMTLRNRLLNFKKSKSNLELVVHDVAALEDRLASGKELSFKPYPKVMEGADPRDATVYASRHGAEAIANFVRDALDKGELVTRASEEKFENQLLDLFRAARTGIEESGANALHLAIGMLQWTETDTAERKLMAPILMLPVSLTRSSVRSGFKLGSTDDEPFINPTLLQLLAEQFDIRIDVARLLPQDAAGIDVERVLQAFRLAIREYKGWEVKAEVHLGMFSFAKFVMWRDLESRLDDLTRNRVVKHLLHTPGQEFAGERADITETDLDDRFSPSQILAPLLADSSQLAALAKAGAGMDLVIIGPPGCGKTQVLANAVAHLIAEGKKVLVCSEKAAALEVLQRRLVQIGLGPFVLELHSSKANKVGVLKQLEEALHQAGQLPTDRWQAEAEHLAGLRDTLNGVVRALHKRRRSGLTVFEATGTVVAAGQRKPSQFDWPDAEMHDAVGFAHLRECAKRAQAVACALPTIKDHALSQVYAAEWSFAWQDDLLQSAQRLMRLAADLEVAAGPVFRTVGLPEKGGSLANYLALDRLADVLLDATGVPGPVARAGHNPDITRRLESLQRHGALRQEAAGKLATGYKPSIEGLSAEDIAQRWRTASAKWIVPRRLAQRAVLRELQPHRQDGEVPTAGEVPGLIDALGILNTEDAEIRTLSAGQESVLGAAWPSVNERLDTLGRCAAWSQRYREALAQLVDASRSVDDMAARLQILVGEQQHLLKVDAVVGQQLVRVRELMVALSAELERARKLSQNTDFAGGPHSAGFLVRLAATAQHWLGSARDLKDWCSWRRARADAISAGLAPLVADIEEGNIAVGSIVEHFDFSYQLWWLKRTVDSDPVLRTFSSADHARKIEEFRSVDRAFQDLTRDYIKAKVAANIPEQRSLQPASESEMGRLRRELQKQRGHQSIRRLIEGMPTLLTRLKPCVLMSPLSVATFLDTANTMFDVVLFDEASQIPAWDAVGAIARARQAVVVGDPKQLPPTNFFQKVDELDDAAEEAGVVADLESILDECLGAGLPSVDLRWHYRSRHEALMAFSNARYYDNGLITFPSNTTEDRSVELRRVAGVYDRGGSRTNRIEADAVVSEIEAHYLNPAQRELSVGVVTFNQPQQRLIEQLLDARRRAKPELDVAIAECAFEPLFIKNLENVQGDERDRMLFSICYGRDQTGRMTMNFGPLNLEGGHRRLNVAITRAREQVMVFSSVTSEDIDPGRVSARGVLDLKTYLDFAAKGHRALATESLPTGREPDSPFEVAVIQRLRDRGWTVHSQVGASGYRIDIGVVHPGAPGRYLLGVECDGAMYHSAATARDRDRLRQMVLEGLGWKLHRIWSSDWWHDAEAQTAKLIDRLNALLRDEEAGGGAEGVPAGGGEEDGRSHSRERFERQATIETTVEPTGKAGKPRYGGTSVRPPVYFRIDIKGGKPEAFYEYGDDDRIRRAIEQIVESEAPVQTTAVFRRVARAWGLERTGARIVENLERLSRGMKATGKGERRFLWRQDDDPSAWSDFRVAGDDEDSKRRPEEVCDEEIQNIAAYLLHHSGSMPFDDLAREVARQVGIGRASKDWVQMVRVACGAKRTAHVIEVRNEGAYLVS